MSAPPGNIALPTQGVPQIGRADARNLLGIRAGLVVLNLLVIVLCAVLLHWRWQQEIDQSTLQARNTAELLARGAAATLDKVALAVAGVVDQTETALARGALHPHAIWPMVDKATARVTEMQTIGLFDRDGQQVCGVPAERCRRLKVADRDYVAWFQANPAAGPRLFGPMASRLDGQRVLILAQGVRDGQGAFAGVAVALLPLQNLTALVGTASLGPNGVASLRTASLEFIARAPALPADKLAVQVTSLTAQFGPSLQNSPDAGVVRARSAVDGSTRINAYRKLAGYPVYAFVGDAADDALASWRGSLWWTAAFLLAFAAASVAIERLATRSHRQQTLARQLYDEAPCGYHTLDTRGRYADINATELGWLGCARDEVIGRLGPKDFYTAGDREPFDANFKRLLAGYPLLDAERDLVSRDGTVRRVAISASPVFDGQGRFVGSSSVVHDITALKRAEEARFRMAELEAQNVALTESARLKNQFLANMSHELRTPLNAVIGFSHLLQTGPAAEDEVKRSRYVQRIGESGRHLLGLVETLLDFGKAEAGKLTFSPSTIHVRSALDKVADFLMPRQLSAGVTIEVHVAPELDTVVNDPLRLRQMLLNLTDNAVKFSPRGAKVKMRAFALDGTTWCVEVEDHGIGIRPDDLDRLFQPFVQVSEGDARTYGGTGLGLALVRQMARAQGGDVTLYSVFGTGSVFTLTLPRTL